mmetsp:Transcript_18760/g.59534  ORF Transcript_18760/g.59534 Transcript_18760/m.59534 type:complete len:86 (+) Transcript_18760:326-583(+)
MVSGEPGKSGGLLSAANESLAGDFLVIRPLIFQPSGFVAWSALLFSPVCRQKDHRRSMPEGARSLAAGASFKVCWVHAIGKNAPS